MIMDHSRIGLNLSVKIRGKEYIVRLCSDKLIMQRDEKDERCIELSSVISCASCDGKMDLVYTEFYDKCKLREDHLSVEGDSLYIRLLSDGINDILTEQRRPQRFLVIINPISGKRLGVKYYKKEVEPLLSRCGVQHQVEITNKAKQSEEILRKYDLRAYDGILAMGGDGHFSDVANALLRIHPRNSDGINDPRHPWEPADIPVGIIPVGSGNEIVKYLHGTKDKKTALLRCLLGKTLYTNSASLQEDGLCRCHSFLVLGFGLFGDMMRDCEKFRSMGPSRYNVIPLVSLMRRRPVDVRVGYLKSSPNPKALHRVLSMPVQEKEESKNARKTRRCHSINELDEEPWETENACVFGIDTHPISLVPKGQRMVPDFNSNCLDLIMTKKCSSFEHIKQLSKVKQALFDCYDYKFITKLEVSAYSVRLQNVEVEIKGQTRYLKSGYYVNCDGEPIRLKTDVFEVRFHKHVISLFGARNDLMENQI